MTKWIIKVQIQPDTINQSLLIDPTSIIPSPLNVGILNPNIRLIHYNMTLILFQRNGNYNTIQKSDILVAWFLENQVYKNLVDAVFHHMIERKRKNNSLLYVELITKILNHVGYPFVEKEPTYVRASIGQPAISKMGYTIQEFELIPCQPRRKREQRNTHPSSSNNEIWDDQRKMNSKINMLVEIMERRNLISIMASSEDNNEMN